MIVKLIKNVKLPCYGITLTWPRGNKRGASLVSDMACRETDADGRAFDRVVDGIEAMILAHFCAGVDIEAPAYIEGIETAYQNIEHNLRMPDEEQIFINTRDEAREYEVNIRAIITLDKSINDFYEVCSPWDIYDSSDESDDVKIIRADASVTVTASSMEEAAEQAKLNAPYLNEDEEGVTSVELWCDILIDVKER